MSGLADRLWAICGRAAHDAARRRVRVGVLAAALALPLLTLPPAGAQLTEKSVSIAGFDTAGLETVLLASFDAGGSETLWSASGSRWGATGTLVGGDVSFDDSTSVVRVMVPRSDGSLLRLNRAGPLSLRDYFGAGGAGADLTVWVQTASGTVSFPASDVHRAGSGYVNFSVPTSGRAVVGGISSGDRFVLALTRSAPAAQSVTNSAPSFPDADDDGAADAVARSVAENTAAGDVGAAIAATDDDGDTLAYSVAATSESDAAANLTAFNSDFALDSATGQLSVRSGAAIDYETRATYKVQVQVTDSKDAAGEADSAIDDTAVLTVTVTNANEPGAVTISGTVTEGETLTASLDDPDGTASSLTWQWSSAATETGSFTDINAATTATYSVAASDVGDYLRATVTYTDTAHSAAGQTAAATVGPASGAAAEEATTTAVSVSEPPGDDLTAGTGTSGVVAPGSAARGRLHEVANWIDSDWFSAELVAGTAYAIEILGTPTVDCTLQAPLLAGIHDSSGTLVAGTEWHATSRDGYTKLEFTPATGGTYYVEVNGEPGPGVGVGTYIVALTEGGDGKADRIAAIGDQGCSAAAPTGLGTSGIAHDSVTLSWTAPEAAAITGYRILRGTSAGSLSEIVADTDSTATTYVDASAAASTTYHYAVAAITAAGAGLPSVSVQTTTPAKPPKDPNAPRTNTAPGATGLTLAPAHDQVTLTWSAPAGTVSGYKIWRGATAGSLAVLVADTGNTDTTYVDQTAEAETEYHYAVAGVNSHGTGPQSAASTTTLEAPTDTETDPEPEPLIAAAAKALEQPVVTFVSNLSTESTAETIIETTADNGIATHDQAFTTGSGNSLFLLDSLRTSAKLNTDADETDSEDTPAASRGNPFLSVSIWTDNNGSIGTELYDLGRTQLPDGHDYGAADVYLFPNTTYWIRFEAQQYSVFDQPLEETETELHHATDDSEHTARAGWSIDGRVMVELQGREIPLGAGASRPTTIISNIDNTRSNTHSTSSGQQYAQSFTTGSAARELASIRVKMQVDDPGVTGIPVVTVHADDSGKPAASALYTLTGPGSVTSQTPETFTFAAPPGATLAANTTYWVRFTASTSILVVIPSTADDSVERVDSGWSFGISSYKNGSEPWAPESRSKLQLAIQAQVESPGRLEGADLPDSRETPISVGVGESAAGSLDGSSDRDWVKIDGLQNNRRYRLEVAFLGTGNIGGSFSLYSAHGGGTASGSGNLWASNWSGNAVLEFSVRDAHAKTYWVVMSPENGMNVFLRQENGQVMRDADNPGGVLAPETVHTGGYVVTLREIGHVQKFVSNLGQGLSDRYEHMVVGHRYSYGLELDQPHEDFLGYFTDYAIDFITGSHPLGYKLDRLEAQIQNGRTRVTAVSVTGEVTNRVVLSVNRLIVTEGSTEGGTYTARLSVQPTEDIVVNITGQAGTDLTVIPDTLTFTTTNWDTAQTVTVTAGADSDSVNDDITLYHNPVGEGFIVSTRAAIRVDDAENFAFVPLPPAPSSNQLGINPRPRPLLTRDSRQTDPNPVITLWQPYNRQEGFDDKFGPNQTSRQAMKLCTFEPNAAYEPGLQIEGERFIDRIYAGDCADLLLKPNTRYWLTFENYNEVPRYSILSSDDFYHVATATHGGQDHGAKDGWSIGDELFWRRHATDKQDTVFQGSGSMRPFMLGFHGTPMGTPDGTPVVANGTHSSWTLSVPDHHSGFVFRQARAAATVSGSTARYSLTVRCQKEDGIEAFIRLVSGTDAEWTAAEAATVQVEAGDYMETSATDAERVSEGNVWLAGSQLSDVLDAFEAAGTGNATFTVTLLDSSNMETGTRTMTVSLRGADNGALGVRQTCQTLFGFSGQTAAPDSTDTESEAADLTLLSAGVDGTTVTLTFDGTLDVGAQPSKSAFTVNVNGAERSILILGMGGSNVLLTLASAVAAGDTVTVDYAKPDGANVVKDTDGNEADSFTGQVVTNNTAAANEGRSESVQPPGSLAVTASESGKLSATWDAPGSGAAPTGYTVQWKQSSGDWDTAADVSEANVKATSYVITGLTDGTAYSVRVVSRDDDADSEPSGEVTATPRAPAANTPATGDPTITGTAQVGETLTASTSAIADANGLSSVSFSYQWLADDVAIANATSATYRLTEAEQGKTIKVRVSFDDDDSNPEQRTSTATAAVAAAPLTATVSAVPSAHSGSGTFTFRLRFSEEPKTDFSWRTLSQHAFTVTGGTVRKARRLAAPSNIGWEITITPTGNGTVTIVLPATTDCAANSAICTNDGRKLTSRVQITVRGP